MATDPPLLGIVTALPNEARSLGAGHARARAIVRIDPRVVAVRAGIGRPRAERAALALVEAGAQALLAWGTAAALDPGLDCGDLVLPRDVITHDGRRIEVDAQWHRSMWMLVESMGRCRSGALAEAGDVLASADDKMRLRALSGALVADMESAAVADVAGRAGVPVLIIRGVSDSAGMGVPTSALAALDESGEVDALRCLLALLRTPRQLPALLRLARGFRSACARLTELAARAGPEFRSPRPVAGNPQA